MQITHDFCYRQQVTMTRVLTYTWVRSRSGVRSAYPSAEVRGALEELSCVVLRFSLRLTNLKLHLMPGLKLDSDSDSNSDSGLSLGLGLGF